VRERRRDADIDMPSPSTMLGEKLKKEGKLQRKGSKENPVSKPDKPRSFI